MPKLQGVEQPHFIDLLDARGIKRARNV